MSRPATILVFALLFLFGGISGAFARQDAIAFRAVGDASRVRVVIDFAQEPEIAGTSYLAGPYRLVVDLPETAFAFEESEAGARGMLSDVRYGLIDMGRSRLLFTFDTPFVAENVQIAANETGQGYRMVIDAVASSQAAFDEALAASIKTQSVTVETGKGDRLGNAASDAARPFTIVLDPGHGGIDGGAKGVSGTVEKDITLTFARELRDLLAANPSYRVVMTRDEDVFVRLDERVRIARQNEADLFVSVHADTISIKGVRGATVYTISDKASDEVARRVAESENLSDAIAGMEIPEESNEVADILIDLTRRETQVLSIRLADSIVGNLREGVELINNPHRYAGFRVLRAPDVPSVLLELGYLSNKQDEQLLRDPDWRKRVSDKLAEAIDAYAGVVVSARAKQP